MVYEASGRANSSGVITERTLAGIWREGKGPGRGQVALNPHDAVLPGPMKSEQAEQKKQMGLC